MLIEANFVMNIWLKEVPQYAVVFCQLSIINNWISILFRSVVIAINATGQVRQISFINGTIYILVLPVSYVMLRMGFGPTIPFILNIVFLFVGHTIFSMMIVKKLIPFFEVGHFFKEVLLKCSLITLLSVFVPLLLHMLLQEGVARFFVVCSCSVLWTLLVLWFIGISKEERLRLINLVCNKLLKQNKL